MRCEDRYNRLMFTGIIQSTGKVVALSSDAITLEASDLVPQLKTGDSIAVNGVCLSVTQLNGKTFAADVMPETFSKTNLGDLQIADPVNLELPLAVNGRLDGHLVAGHVEGTGEITGITPEGNAYRVIIQPSSELLRYIIPKGSVTVNGISLTVADASDSAFSVSLIPITWQQTTFYTLAVGSKVNIETDLVAKYIEKFTQT